MKHGLLLGVLVTFALTGTTASAQVYNWTGAYVGAQIGYGTGHTDWDYFQVGTTADHSINGVIGGNHLGYNHQLGNILLGIETEINGSDISGDTKCPNPTFSCTSRIRWLGSTRGRIGYALNRFLPYLTGGVAYGSWRVGAVGSGAFRENNTRVGWTAGTGVAYAITDLVSARAEYAFYQLERGRSSDFPGEFLKSQGNAHTIRAGMSFKFWTP